MRTVIPLQLSLGETDIGAIKIDVTSRDDIPSLKILETERQRSEDF